MSRLDRFIGGRRTGSGYGHRLCLPNGEGHPYKRGGDDERHHSDEVVRPLGGSSWSRDHRVVVVGWDETIEPATPLIAPFPLQVQMGPAAHSYDDQVADRTSTRM